MRVVGRETHPAHLRGIADALELEQDVHDDVRALQRDEVGAQACALAVVVPVIERRFKVGVGHLSKV